MIKIILTIIIILSLLTLLFITLYTKILVSKTRVDKAEKEIENELNKRFKLIKEMEPIIEKSTKKDIKDLKELKKTNVSTFDLDKKIESTFQTINIMRNDYPKLDKKKDFKELVTKLEESNTYINAAKSYFNSYNKELLTYSKKFPTNIMCLFMKISKKPYYEGKNVFSDIDI